MQCNLPASVLAAARAAEANSNSKRTPVASVRTQKPTSSSAKTATTFIRSMRIASMPTGISCGTKSLRHWILDVRRDAPRSRLL
jgi:hypothetical protein